MPGEQNVSADTLSRANFGDFYRLRQTIFREIEYMSMPITIDRFASACNAQVRAYNAQFTDIGAIGIDAFAQSDYAEHINFCNPPVALLGRFTCFAIDHLPPSTKLIVIFPLWEAQPWFPRLLKYMHTCLIIPGYISIFEKCVPFAVPPYCRNKNW